MSTSAAYGDLLSLGIVTNQKSSVLAIPYDIHRESWVSVVRDDDSRSHISLDNVILKGAHCRLLQEQVAKASHKIGPQEEKHRTARRQTYCRKKSQHRTARRQRDSHNIGPQEDKGIVTT